MSQKFHNLGNPTGTQDTSEQDNTSAPFHWFMMTEDKTDITLSTAYAAGVRQVTVSASHGFTVGSVIFIREGQYFHQTEVTAVATNLISFKSPTMFPFTTNAVVVRGRKNLAAASGSIGTPLEFVYKSWGVIPTDVVTVKILMSTTGQPNDLQFGDDDPLDNGLRFRRENSEFQNYGVYSKNQDFEVYGASFTASEKAGGGYGSRILFSVKDCFGLALRFYPHINQNFVCYLEDDLSSIASITELYVCLLGHFTQGEERG